jgi:hypothetical protein
MMGSSSPVTFQHLLLITNYLNRAPSRSNKKKLNKKNMLKRCNHVKKKREKTMFNDKNTKKIC